MKKISKLWQLRSLEVGTGVTDSQGRSYVVVKGANDNLLLGRNSSYPISMTFAADSLGPFEVTE